jgi:uncharacterized protein (TIGR03545 family)
MRRVSLFRWRAIVPLMLLFVVMGLVTFLLLDTMVRRGIESSGSYFVGARVELESADVRLGDGSVRLRGLQVTNPDAPMTNLLEAEEIVIDIRKTPLLTKRMHIDTVALRGLAFGTARSESGALENPPEGAGRIRREVDQWAARVAIPPLSLEGLGRAIDVGAIRPESLRTLAAAARVEAGADSMVTSWTAQLARLDPAPRLDSAQALLARLEDADPIRLGVTGTAALANDARRTLDGLGDMRSGILALDSTARAGVDGILRDVRALADARAEDYRYALGLLQLPSLDAPTISPAIFGASALQWMQPVLYWVRLAEEYLPPGLDPRRRAGPQRARARGTTVVFPGGAPVPRFVLEHADADLTIGTGAAVGAYRAAVSGLSSAPTLYGKPVELRVERLEGARGPRDVRVYAALDHVQAPIADSVDVVLTGIGLPALELAAIGARLTLGDGQTALQLSRVGERIQARWRWATTAATWERLHEPSASADTATIGSTAWANALLWRAVSGVREVTVDVRLSGTIAAPALGVSSNIGDVVARSLRSAIGREVERAEREVRSRVDALVADGVGRAARAGDALRQQAADQIGAPLAELTEVEDLIEAEVRRLTGRVPRLRLP